MRRLWSDLGPMKKTALWQQTIIDVSTLQSNVWKPFCSVAMLYLILSSNCLWRHFINTIMSPCYMSFMHRKKIITIEFTIENLGHVVWKKGPKRKKMLHQTLLQSGQSEYDLDNFGCLLSWLSCTGGWPWAVIIGQRSSQSTFVANKLYQTVQFKSSPSIQMIWII